MEVWRKEFADFWLLRSPGRPSGIRFSPDLHWIGANDETLPGVVLAMKQMSLRVQNLCMLIRIRAGG